MPLTEVIICGFAGSDSIIFRSFEMLTSKVFPPSFGIEQTESAQMWLLRSSSLVMTRSGFLRKYVSRTEAIPFSCFVLPLHQTCLLRKSIIVFLSLMELSKVSGFDLLR